MTNYFEEINKWADERSLLSIGYAHDKQCSFILEEISELLRAKDEYEIVDALCDIIVFSANSAKILDRTIIIDENLIKNYSDITIRKEADKIILSSDLLELFNELFLDKNDANLYYIDLILLAIKGLLNFGYDPLIALEETLKEINSRTGAFNPGTGKWEKFETKEAKALWYKADYSLAKVSWIMNQLLESNFSINEDVNFIPMYRDTRRFGISHKELLDGKIIAIRFTEQKIFYDCLSIFYGKIFRDIDSCKVYKIKTLPLEE